MIRTLALACAIFLMPVLLLAQPAAAGSPLDYDTANGHFYTQANGYPLGQNSTGFEITDDGGIPFWTEYRWFGGSKVLGYPISSRFIWDGLVCQATQRAVLQWHPGERQVRLANILDYMSFSQKDDWLLAHELVPRPLDQTSERGLAATQIKARRLALLSANPAIKSTYYAAPDPLALYGLPTSAVTDTGPAFAIRMQRGVIYVWKYSLPWASAGQVTVAAAGDLFKASGLLPAEAISPESPPPQEHRATLSDRGSQRDPGPMSGKATWYGAYFQNKEMRNGEQYDMYDPTTTASNAYPLGTLLKVTHAGTGAYVIVRVTDRGAFKYPIIVDLSYAAFRLIANPAEGVVRVNVEPVE